MSNLLGAAGSALSNLLSPDPGMPPEQARQSALSIAWQDAGGAMLIVRFDVVTAETHETLMAITDHPVEVGANVVDNARELPTTIAIEGYISNVPLDYNPVYGSRLKQQSMPIQVGSVPLKLSLASAVNAVTSGIANAISGGGDSKTALVQSPTGTFPKFRPKLVYELLELARTQRALVRVVTSLRTVNSMLIERVGVPRSVADGTGATFNVALRQLRLVSSQTVNAPQPTEARGLIAAATGSKATQPTDDDTDKQSQSILLQGAIGLGLVDE